MAKKTYKQKIKDLEDLLKYLEFNFMICPNCLIQMVQKDRVGGGTAEDERYITWELKECLQCGRTVVEYYEARVLEPLLLQDLLAGETIAFTAQLNNLIKRKK